MRLVIKIGSSSLTYPSGHINIRFVEKFCKILADLQNAGHEIILVSSGAIALGVGKMRLSEKPSDLTFRQALASIGQCELMYMYDKLFLEYGHTVAQVLVTYGDIADQKARLNLTNTLNKLIELRTIPIINENDAISTVEITLGDNDNLAAKIATLVQAEILVLLSDIDGLYTANPRVDKNATLIPVVYDIDEHIEAIAGGAGTKLGTGGMSSKIKAAKTCVSCGIDMIISNSNHPELLYTIIEGGNVGTRFVSKNDNV